jgi:hypothetical protein
MWFYGSFKMGCVKIFENCCCLVGEYWNLFFEFSSFLISDCLCYDCSYDSLILCCLNH